MKLYFSPLACSMASRIAFYEAGQETDFVEVDPHSKTIVGGGDFFAVNPMGQVPAVETDDGRIVTENVAVLQLIADQLPSSHLAPPPGSADRVDLHRWLNFIATEIHKATFIPLLDPHAPEGAKDYARSKAQLRFGYLDLHLADHEHLLDDFTVADAYLFTVLNWARPTGIDLSEWPAVKTYYEKIAARPAVARALVEELELYRLELQRKHAA